MRMVAWPPELVDAREENPIFRLFPLNSAFGLPFYPLELDVTPFGLVPR
jgi:hypothetical protein